MSDTSSERQRRTLPLIIVVLATIVGFASVFGLWVKRQALETETFAETSGELLQNEDVRNAVADFVVATIYNNVDVQTEIASQLPPQAQALAAPAAAGLRQLATNAMQKVLAEPRVQEIWEQATGAAQERLIALLDDEGEFVSTTGGTVTLDLTGLITSATAQIGIGGNIASKLPPEAGQIEILKSDELSAAQTGIKVLRTLAWALSALTLLLYAAAIWLAHGRRRETLRAVGYSFAFIGLVVLLTRNAAGNLVISSLAASASIEPAVDATWEISTSLLLETAQSLIAYGVVIVFAAWLAGPTAIATSVRRSITPYLRQPLVAFGTAATIVVALLAWDPVVATHRLIPSLLLALLLFGGVEALRRQVIREFPHHVDTRIRRPTVTSAKPGADRIDQLERLARLREAGILDDAELAAEKEKIS